MIRRATWRMLRTAATAAAAAGLTGGCGSEPDAEAATTATAVSAPAPAPADAPANAPESAPTPWFEPLTDHGVDFVHRSGEQGEYRLMASMCGGVALFDADGDGDLDLYLVQAGDHDEPTAREPNQLYLNDGAGRFRDITETSGTGDRGYGMGVACGDFDGDGLIDLYVTNMGPNVLYRNLGDGIFEDV
ncbi:MAG: FG-GAP repeat domain-containing protein, partial [Planctomycetota bacterium]